MRAPEGPSEAKDLSGGTDYDFFASDSYTPTPGQAPPLGDNIQSKIWGDTPLDFVEWFDSLWHTGDPSQWGPQVFTQDAVMIDSTGTSTGANQAAADFLLLFKYFPSLRGEVISWAHNDREILLNWRFIVTNDIHVPVIDKFSFVKGLVSFRMAYFDTMSLLSYLAENHGSGPLVDYFMDRFWESERGLEVLFVPKLIWALLKGIFHWSALPLPAPTGVSATPGDGQVALRWNPVPGAASYTVKRAEALDGSYHWVAPQVQTNSHVDKHEIKAGTQYYYKICANCNATVTLPYDSPSQQSGGGRT